MAGQKPRYTFHNPNGSEETERYITALLAEALINRLESLSSLAAEPERQKACETAASPY